MHAIKHNMEKSTISSMPEGVKTKSSSRKFKSGLLLCLVPIGTLMHTFGPTIHLSFKSNNASVEHDSPIHVFKDQCRQVDPLFPNKTSSLLDDVLNTISTPKYKKQSIEYLSNAVKIPTVSHDGMGPPGEDKRWEIFYDFAAYLNETFPLVHENLMVEKVNTHGLLYTWKGSDEHLKPTLLMAHQDVVPVPESTIPTW